MALDAPNRKAPRRKPARKPAPKRPASRGPQGLPGPSKPVITKGTVRARRREQIRAGRGPQNLPGPQTPVITKKAVEGRKDVLRKRVKVERKRLGLTTKIELDKKRTVESLARELRIARQANSRKHAVLGGLLGHQQRFYDRSTGKRIPTASDRNPSTYLMKLATGRVDAQKASVAAPALKVLEQTTRPLHGIAAGTNAALKGKNVLKATGRGLANKDKTTFSDVLKTAHAPKVVQGVGGFALDVGLDPTTYVTGGAAPALRKTVEKAARDAASKALEQGATREAARAASKRAAAQVLAKGHRPGVQINVAGKKVATVRAGKRASKVHERVHDSSPVQLARHVNPNIRPAGVSRDDWERARAATRRERAISATGESQSRNRAIALSKALKGDQGAHQRITDAIEAKDLEKLSPHERKVAHALTRDYEEMFGREKAAKLIRTELQDLGYLPRHVDAELDAGTVRSKKKLGGAQLEAAKTRTERRSRAEFRGTDDDVYVGDLAVSRYLRGRDSAVKLGRASTYQELRGLGRRYRGQTLREHEGLYRFVGNKKPERLEGDQLRAALKGKGGDGRVIILNDHLVNRTLGPEIHRLKDLEDVGALWDRAVQGRIKTILTVPNPQYHLTNLYGDLHNAYLGQNVASLARNMGISVKALRAKAKREAAIRTLDKRIDPSSKGVRIDGRPMSYDDLIREAEEHGAIAQGFIGRDLPELLDAQGKQFKERIGQGKVTRRAGKVGQKIGSNRVTGKIIHPLDTIRDASQYREDAVRLATYLGARKRGMSADEASTYVARHHFDYGDLSQFERSVLRRVFPFYTFTSRNTPLQARTLLEKPGKLANIEKVREEAAKAAGYGDDWEEKLKEYEQRGVPIPIPGLKDKDGRPLNLYPKLPLTDLNRLSTKGQVDAVTAMVTPIVQVPLQYSQNYSFWFKDKIDKLAGTKDPDTGEEIVTLKAVPKWLNHEPLKSLLGVKEFTVIRKVNGKETRQRAVGIPAKRAYLLSTTPETSNLLQFGTGVENTRGQSGGLRAFGYATGLKLAPQDRPKQTEDRLFEKRAYLQNVADSMRKQEVPGAAYVNGDPTRRTKRYQTVLDQIAGVEKELGIRASKKAPPKVGALADPEIRQALEQHNATRQKQQGILADPEVQKALDRLKAGG